MVYLSLGLVGLLALDLLRDLWEARARGQEVAKGRAGLYTLRLMTGLWDREALKRHFGEPDADVTFAVTAESLGAARTGLQRLFDRRWIDWSLFGAALVTAVIALVCTCAANQAMILAMAALAYRALFWGHRAFLMLRATGQMSDEIRTKFEKARQS